MVHWAWLVVAFVVGGWVGVVMACLAMAADERDRQRPYVYRDEID